MRNAVLVMFAALAALDVGAQAGTSRCAADTDCTQGDTCVCSRYCAFDVADLAELSDAIPHCASFRTGYCASPRAALYITTDDAHVQQRIRDVLCVADAPCRGKVVVDPLYSLRKADLASVLAPTSLAGEMMRELAWVAALFAALLVYAPLSLLIMAVVDKTAYDRGLQQRPHPAALAAAAQSRPPIAKQD